MSLTSIYPQPFYNYDAYFFEPTSSYTTREDSDEEEWMDTSSVQSQKDLPGR